LVRRLCPRIPRYHNHNRKHSKQNVLTVQSYRSLDTIVEDVQNSGFGARVPVGQHLAEALKILRPQFSLLLKRGARVRLRGQVGTEGKRTVGQGTEGNTMAMSREEWKAHLAELLPEVLREDPQVRDQIYVIISQVCVTRAEFETILAELRTMREDFDRRAERHDQVLDEHSRRIEDLAAAIHQQGQELAGVKHSVSSLERTVSAVGTRWGVMAEEAFRAGLRTLVESALGSTVERWRARDAEGTVYGAPADVEVDVVVRDGQHVLVELKASISSSEVGAFNRICQLYTKARRAADRRIMISPFVTDEARRLAKDLAVELYTTKELEGSA